MLEMMSNYEFKDKEDQLASHFTTVSMLKYNIFFIVTYYVTKTSF